MSAITPYNQTSFKRQKAKRPSIQVSNLRRFTIIAIAMGALALGLWGYFHASVLVSQVIISFENISASLGFTLEDVVVQGRIRTDTDYILKSLQLEKGKPLVSINLSEAKAKLENISWVHAVTIDRRLPDTLFIRISEKHPIALWLKQSKTFLVDRDGGVMETTEAHKYKELLIVTGQDIPDHIGEFMTLLDKFPEIKEQTTGATYVRSGRWDIKLNGRIDVKLPERDVEKALSYLLELEKNHDLMEREIVTVDMRFPEKLILRLTPEAARKKNATGKDA